MGAVVSVGSAATADFDTFYEQTRPGALRLATLLTQDRTGAEDIVQEAFSTMYRRWDSIEEPAAYLRTVIVNGVRTQHRRREREKARLLKLGACGADAMHADEIADALAVLPYRQRATIVLFFYADLPEREIAETLGCPVGTVKSLKSRALARLREAIDQ
ncbi:MAG TPA: SigE family RNA polymerase sigma factor [Acidimicrobiia bacterium]|nr:SigE family RNA polymerase sigma factor [Acidimicrobiia bacterium]